MASLFFAFDYTLDNLLRILLPFSMAVQFLLDIVFIKIRLIHNAFGDEFLKTFRQTEELFLVNGIN